MIEAPPARRAPLMRRIARNRLVLVGLIIIIFLILLALFPRVFAPYDPDEIEMKSALQPPRLEHPFGTDRYGRDILSRVIYGTRVSLGVAFSSVAIALLIGSILGLFPVTSVAPGISSSAGSWTSFSAFLCCCWLLPWQL